MKTDVAGSATAYQGASTHSLLAKGHPPAPITTWERPQGHTNLVVRGAEDPRLDLGKLFGI